MWAVSGCDSLYPLSHVQVDMSLCALTGTVETVRAVLSMSSSLHLSHLGPPGVVSKLQAQEWRTKNKGGVVVRSPIRRPRKRTGVASL